MTATTTLTHLDAADGSRLIVTTRIDRDGCLRVDVYRNDDKRGTPICSGVVSQFEDSLQRKATMTQAQKRAKALVEKYGQAVAEEMAYVGGGSESYRQGVMTALRTLAEARAVARREA